MEEIMEKKLTIEKNGMKITLEGYSIQELNNIFVDEPVREVNLNELLNRQKSAPVKITPFTIGDDFIHLVDTEEQKRMFSEKHIIVSDPKRPFFKVISII